MTTVKKLKEYLDTLPENMVVQVLRERTHGWATTTDWVDLEIHPYTGGTNIVGNVLELGEK